MELLFPRLKAEWDGINLVWNQASTNDYEQTSGIVTFPGRLY